MRSMLINATKAQLNMSRKIWAIITSSLVVHLAWRREEEGWNLSHRFLISSGFLTSVSAIRNIFRILFQQMISSNCAVHACIRLKYKKFYIWLNKHKKANNRSKKMQYVFFLNFMILIAIHKKLIKPHVLYLHIIHFIDLTYLATCT